MSYELAFIGAGNMAEAIARGLLRAGTIAPGKMIAADVSQVRRELFQQELKIRSVATPAEAARDARTVLLAVKPQQMGEVLAELAPFISPRALVVSIAAGVPTKLIESGLGADLKMRVVRTMPNTPMLVGLGAIGIAPGAHASPDDVRVASALFAPAGVVVEVAEDQLDAVTAVSGSGPAYVFYLVEQMIAAGVDLGLAPGQAALLARQTALGAATMLATGESPESLRRKVTSPNGTTQAAIESMEAAHVGASIQRALAAAHQRSVELGNKS